MEVDSKYQDFLIDIKNFNIVKKIQSTETMSSYLVKNIETNKFSISVVVITPDDEPDYNIYVNKSIESLIHCQHPLIVKFLGYSPKDFKNQDNITIFTEYHKNNSLAELLQKSRNPSNEDNINDFKKISNTNLQIILIGIVRGLMIFHQNKITIKSLNPENILLDKDMHPLINNFDQTLFQADQLINNLKYDPMYLAPEILSDKNFDKKADIYSLGMIMYEIVTGSIPYKLLAKGKMNIMKFINFVVNKNGRPKFEVEVKKSIEELIKKCWSNDPSERPTPEEIFKKLSFDENYYLSDVNATDVTSYAKLYDSSEKNTEKEIDIKNMKIPENMNSSSLFETLNSIVEEISKINKRIDELENKFDKLKRGRRTIKNSDNKNEDKKDDDVDNDENEDDEIIDDNQEEYEADDPDSISYFNSLKLKSQKSMIEEVFTNLQNKESKQFFTKIKELIDFLLKFKKIDTAINLQIETEKKSETLGEIKAERKICLLISPKEYNDCLGIQDDSEIKNYLSNFSELFVEVRQDVALEFLDVYNYFAKLATPNPKNFKLGVYIHDIQEIGTMYHDLKLLNCVRIDSNASIFNESFKNCKTLEKVSFDHSSITEICKSAFYDCSLLTQINIPSSVTSIGCAAFCYCRSLTQISIPSSVTSIGQCAFLNCSSLAQITIPSSVTEIAERAFYECSSLKQFTFPPSLTSIKSQTLYYCTSLVQISVPPSVTSISGNAFEGCNNLLYITLPSKFSRSSIMLPTGTNITKC